MAQQIVSTRLSAAFDRAAERAQGYEANAPALGSGKVVVGQVLTVYEDGDLIVRYPGGTGIASPVTDEFCGVGRQVYLMADPGGVLVVLGMVK